MSSTSADDTAGAPVPEVSALLQDALNAIGDRWALPILYALGGGPARFGELTDGVVGIAPNILSSRLRQLEARGLIVARPYQRRPLRMLYELTPAGAELLPVAAALANWEARRSGRVAPAVHALCGTPLESRWYCLACGETVAGGQDDGADQVELI